VSQTDANCDIHETGRGYSLQKEREGPQGNGGTGPINTNTNKQQTNKQNKQADNKRRTNNKQNKNNNNNAPLTKHINSGNKQKLMCPESRKRS
jgi:hypothetical protein